MLSNLEAFPLLKGFHVAIFLVPPQKAFGVGTHWKSLAPQQFLR